MKFIICLTLLCMLGVSVMSQQRPQYRPASQGGRYPTVGLARPAILPGRIYNTRQGRDVSYLQEQNAEFELP